MREANGVHTCDRRSRKSEIQKAFPRFDFEDGFTEEDELWDAEHRETDEELDARMLEVFDDVWNSEKGMVVSLTIHSAAIAGMLRVLGHRVFALPTGGALPVIVKGPRGIVCGEVSS